MNWNPWNPAGFGGWVLIGVILLCVGAGIWMWYDGE